MRLLDRAGRRTLLMVGVSGMTISLFTLGLAFRRRRRQRLRLRAGDRKPDGLRRLLCDRLLTLAFCWKVVPETKGKRLEDIQACFQARVDGT
jgi:hypothetical protein